MCYSFAKTHGGDVNCPYCPHELEYRYAPISHGPVRKCLKQWYCNYCNYIKTEEMKL
jgi:hypothetical protein